ncbi:hypothetical protein RGR602_CH01233 [Rhizobium gallicum bv. gallicum R602sp]|uniref:Uncharacterized protein n=1 Tax=Rhizobium gallicum bv. gallicum R602sp TaxID=1041138 RepID=A0A0B4X077_9HYPH|nr:hypothetical protein RGR602_CH01233 [Rhizobium gallicum bv. gallicum R602sp]
MACPQGEAIDVHWLAFPSIRRSVRRASPTGVGQRTAAAYGKGNRLLLSLGIGLAPLIFRGKGLSSACRKTCSSDREKSSGVGL